MYTIFSNTIESTAVNHLESINILGESQCAFRKDRRIEDHTFTLHGICSLSKSSKKPLYIAFLDLSKAFDRVWRERLLTKLWESGIQGKPWRLIKEIYRNVKNKVVFNDYESDYFNQEYGVKQSCVLSSTLFSVLMNDLVQMLSDTNIGVNISLNLTNCLLFADDVVLMAESPRELQTLLRISHQFAKKWNLKFNSKKCKVMVVGKRINNNSTWKLGDESIFFACHSNSAMYVIMICFVYFTVHTI
jgi:hypothetical protein